MKGFAVLDDETRQWVEDGPLKYHLGVDGGGTGCRARLADVHGRTLGEGSAGPGNLALGIDLAVDALLTAARQAIAQAGLREDALGFTRAGLGMAAANVPAHREALARASLPFLSSVICSDAEAACLGAHAGEDGGVLILGTGSQGVVRARGEFKTLGGWGFAISDDGSGAMLGRAAVRRAFQAHEGIAPASPLTREIMGRFDSQPVKLLEWAAKARPTDWAVFARTVFEHVDHGDDVALALLQANARAVDGMLERMLQIGARRIALMGGIARPTRPYLAKHLDAVLVEPQGDALAGALLLARGQAPGGR